MFKKNRIMNDWNGLQNSVVQVNTINVFIALLEDERLYIIFDKVHLLKCIRNNRINALIHHSPFLTSVTTL